MKRILLLAAVLLCMTGGTLRAQNWQELLKQTATSLGDRATDGKLTQYALPGNWTYTAPGVRFEGESAASDPGAALIASMVREQLVKVYEKAGIRAGSSTVSFDNRGGFTTVIGEQTIAGNYEYDASNHTISVRFTDEKLAKLGTVAGRAYLSGSELQLLFPVTGLLELAKSVSSQVSSLEAVSTLLSSYKDLYIGFAFERAN
ncbi:DUF4923 family protein [Alistipes sp.]|uniref:lipocalin-like domain-containing protein n=1 Tax=Alistipes sp. TaxID=1872444 RepID=UPI0025BDBDE4|nr:DUF4923 family protein [Alistipes sp.]MCI7140911.1 DUF4923 family protein [Alistipes sp.]MDY5396001.1 DUF4923 family protein [Alistipes sp.]